MRVGAALDPFSHFERIGGTGGGVLTAGATDATLVHGLALVHVGLDETATCQQPHTQQEHGYAYKEEKDEKELEHGKERKALFYYY